MKTITIFVIQNGELVMSGTKNRSRSVRLRTQMKSKAKRLGWKSIAEEKPIALRTIVGEGKRVEVHRVEHNSSQGKFIVP